MPEPVLRRIVLEGKELGMSTALSGHLKISDLDELARINPDIVGVRGAVCASGDRGRTVALGSGGRVQAGSSTCAKAVRSAFTPIPSRSPRPAAGWS